MEGGFRIITRLFALLNVIDLRRFWLKLWLYFDQFRLHPDDDSILGVVLTTLVLMIWYIRLYFTRYDLRLLFDPFSHIDGL